MHPDFDPPTRGQIAGRTSSITAAFFQAITPVRVPSDAEVDEVLAVLGMSPGNCRCAYCGDARTEWDHFRPIVKERQPTGYITEIANLVPSCGKCNQSKGNKNWKEWMLSQAKRSPKQRQIPDLPARVARLEAFEKWREPAWVNLPTGTRSLSTTSSAGTISVLRWAVPSASAKGVGATYIFRSRTRMSL
jgi:hypothetical protein